MTREEYTSHQEKVIEIVNLTRDRISPAALKGIEHYLDHGELELALELLCLEVSGEKIDLPQDKKGQLLDLAENLLDPGSVYDPGVFEKLHSYVSGNGRYQ